MIIGVTGNYASGKDTVADILQEQGFIHISLSDLIREHMKKNDIKITRENLIKAGNQLREENGPDILAKRAIEKFQDNNNYVISSIRNPSEVETLQTREDFFFVNVTAPEEVRLKRLVERNRENDPKTLEELRVKEAKENSIDSNAQQLNKVAHMTKFKIVNQNSLEVLKEKVKELINKLTNSS